MGSLFHDDKQPFSRGWRTAVFSVAAHVVIFAFILVGARHMRHVLIFKPAMAGSASQVSMISLSHSALAAALAPRTTTVKKSRLPRTVAVHPTIHPPENPAPAPKTPQPSESAAINPGVTGAGDDAQSMYPAYPTVSPTPPVSDRSLLPPTDRKIVVDVNLSADGKVQEATLVSGMGNALDQIVLNTVRVWQFHPAMRNGSPVPSSMELVFPFNRDYPISG